MRSKFWRTAALGAFFAPLTVAGFGWAISRGYGTALVVIVLIGAMPIAYLIRNRTRGRLVYQRPETNTEPHPEPQPFRSTR